MVFECLRDFFDVVLGFILEKKGFAYFFMPIFVVGIWGGTRGLTVNQLNRLNPKEESTSHLLSVCRELLRNEQHADVVPFLEEAVFRLEDDPEKKAQQTLAFSIFQLADCFMKLGDYQRAAEGFRRFADLFYLDPQRNDARLLASECFSLVGFWAEAEAEAEHVLKDMLLEDEMERSALRLFLQKPVLNKKMGGFDRASSKIVSIFAER